VFTAQFSLSHACYILTYPLAGWIGAAAGLGWAALTLTVVAAVGSTLAFLSWPGPRGETPAGLHARYRRNHPPTAPAGPSGR
jgi:hypothetical protein